MDETDSAPVECTPPVFYHLRGSPPSIYRWPFVNRLVPRFSDFVSNGGLMMVERTGALGYFGDARQTAVGPELIERVSASGSVVIRKLGETRAGELAIHRFLSAPLVTCKEMLGTLAGRRIVVAQDTTEINFAGREANRCGFGPGGYGVSAGFFIHPLVAIDSETEAGRQPSQMMTR